MKVIYVRILTMPWRGAICQVLNEVKNGFNVMLPNGFKMIFKREEVESVKTR
jgi:hypothetical protein